MSKMHEYTGDVTVRLVKRMTYIAADEDDFFKVVEADICDCLAECFDEGDIKGGIEVDDVRKVG